MVLGIYPSGTRRRAPGIMNEAFLELCESLFVPPALGAERLATVFHQQKRGWTGPLSAQGGVHPLSPGALVAAARGGTQSAPKKLQPSALNCPAFFVGTTTPNRRRGGAGPCAKAGPSCRHAVRRTNAVFETPSPGVCARQKPRSHLNLSAIGRVSTAPDCPTVILPSDSEGGSAVNYE